MGRRVVLVWSLLALAIAALALLESLDGFERPPPPPTGTLAVFDFAEPELGAVELLYQGGVASLMRASDGGWFRHGAGHRHRAGADAAVPGEVHAADPERAAAIRDQLAITARMTADRRVEPDRALDAYGLAPPPVMFAFYGQGADGAELSRPLGVLYVGDLLPDGFAYYARLEGDAGLLIVPRYQVALLLALAFGAEQAPTPLPARPAARE